MSAPHLSPIASPTWLPGGDYRWYSVEGQVTWSQQLEFLSVLDCAYPVQGRLQAAAKPRATAALNPRRNLTTPPE